MLLTVKFYLPVGLSEGVRRHTSKGSEILCSYRFYDELHRHFVQSFGNCLDLIVLVWKARKISVTEIKCNKYNEVHESKLQTLIFVGIYVINHCTRITLHCIV